MLRGTLLFLINLVAANATDLYSCPGSLSAGSYTLQANLTEATSAYCITVTGMTSYLEINLNGHSVNGTNNLNVHDNNGVVWWYGGTFIGNVRVIDNVGNDPSRDGSGPSTWSTGNAYNYPSPNTLTGYYHVYNTPYFYSINDTLSNNMIVVEAGSNGIYINNITVDDTTSGGLYYGILIQDTDNISVIGGTVTGHAGAQGSGGNVDDGIACVNCSNIYIDGFSSVDMFDAGIEFIGTAYNYTVINTTHTRPWIAGIGCYNLIGWQCKMNSGYIDSNTVTHGQSGTELFLLGGDGTSTSYFTNTTLSNNSIDSSTQSVIGNGQFYTVSGVTLTGNHFGSGSTVYFGSHTSGGGYTDGGGNYCSTTSPSPGPITCH